MEDRKLMATLTGGSGGEAIDDAAPEIVQVQQQQEDGITGGIQRIVNGEQTDQFPAVGFVGPLGCTGTLISPTHVLTAAHCTEGVGNTAGSFEVNGQTYRTTSIVNHPDYNANDFGAGHDLAILVLDRPVEGVTPMQLHTGTPQVGMNLTLVGFGEGGTSTGGFDPNDTGKQVGETRLDEVTAEHINWNFDSHNESNTAPGDSGGPAFVRINGQYQIIGVTSGGTGDAHTLGDYSFDTRIDIHANWIEGVVGDTVGDSDDGGDDDGDAGNDQDDHADTPNNDATRIVVGGNNLGSATGTIEAEGDRDAFWFNIRDSGETEITLKGTGADAGLDTYLRIYNSQGTLVSQNDDFGGQLSSKVTLTTSPGRYYAVAGTYQDSETGDFRLDIDHTPDTASGGDYQTFENNRTREISPDRVNRVTTAINVRNVDGNVSDINVTVDIEHTWVEDLRLILISPEGDRIVLVNRQGGDGDNFDNTTFDSQANKHINRGEAPFRGTFRPAHNLNRLNGMNPNGRWKLTVADFAAGDGGQLNGWKMDIATDSSRAAKKISSSRMNLADFSPEQTSQTEVAEQGVATQRASQTCSLAGHVEATQTGESIDFRHLDDSSTETGSSDVEMENRRLNLLDSVFTSGVFDLV